MTTTITVNFGLNFFSVFLFPISFPDIEKWMLFGGSWGSTLSLAYAVLDATSDFLDANLYYLFTLRLKNCFDIATGLILLFVRTMLCLCKFRI